MIKNSRPMEPRSLFDLSTPVQYKCSYTHRIHRAAFVVCAFPTLLYGLLQDFSLNTPCHQLLFSMLSRYVWDVRGPKVFSCGKAMICSKSVRLLWPHRSIVNSLLPRRILFYSSEVMVRLSIQHDRSTRTSIQRILENDRSGAQVSHWDFGRNAPTGHINRRTTRYDAARKISNLILSHLW